MSQEALAAFKAAVDKQRDSNDARRIRNRVDHARRDPHTASIRWPFELLQNALDAGPREGRSAVAVRLHQEPNHVRFEHDGAAFSSQELAVLLSGGSSKELDSEHTTGRFGTGFLVTHVLAEETRVVGLLRVKGGYERFEIMLDRKGDEEAILSNISLANAAIYDAAPAPKAAHEPSAAFEYAITDSKVWETGLQQLDRALPYLYMTRPALGRVEVRTDDDVLRIWEPSSLVETEVNSGLVQTRHLSASRSGHPTQRLSILRFSENSSARAAALVLLEKCEGGWAVRIPEADSPRVFRSYPLRDSGFLPVNLVIDGNFTTDQERSGVTMDEHDKSLFEEALRAGVFAIGHATRERWHLAHRLAEASNPDRGFRRSDEAEPAWWKTALATFAKDLAGSPIVACRDAYRPAHDNEGRCASFLDLRLQSRKGEPETSMERLWPLADATLALRPPNQDIAADWTRIVSGWRSLGLDIQTLSVARVGQHARGTATTLQELGVQSEAGEWLADWLDVVGECWAQRPGDMSPLEGMLPDQKQHLHGPADLRRDGGVSERLKDIYMEAGCDIRKQLLWDGFGAFGQAAGRDHLQQTLTTAVPTEETEATLNMLLVDRILACVEIGKLCPKPEPPALLASIPFLAHLATGNAAESKTLAERVPYLTMDGHVESWRETRKFMAPVRVWPEAAQPFVEVYPPDRVLNDLYADRLGASSLISALEEWGIAVCDPLTRETINLRDRRLEELVTIGDAQGTTVPNATLSQIAFLGDVLNRCQEDREKAKKLLGLVLCHVARRDGGWKTVRTMQGKRSGAVLDLKVRGALWLADLKVRGWVPEYGEDNKLQKMPATAARLSDLLEPSWLQGNDDAARLLSECFGFDRLELRLLGVPEDKRAVVRNSLAGFLETVGDDPGRIQQLANEEETLKRHRRDVDRCRSLGLAVQKAVAESLTYRGLDVTLVDRGFDYEVTIPPHYEDNDAGKRFGIGPYLVEVKATTTGRVRLTPMQAATASAQVDRYVLCVVDLRSVPKEDRDRTTDWSAEQVEPLASLVSDIGARVRPTYCAVEGARMADVAIRNETALRYEVPEAIWKTGIPVNDWVGANQGGPCGSAADGTNG